MRTLSILAAMALAAPLFTDGIALAQPETARLQGVYQAIADTTVLPGGRRNAGSPRDIPVRPAAAARAQTSDLQEDAYKVCLPVGPFRMMAADRAKIEIVPTPTSLVMLFEDLSHGYMRTFYTTRAHRAGAAPTWQGDSVARWEGSTLVVDTIALSDRVWLNERGVQHSGALHLVERITPILEGKYLEYRVTAEDATVLTAPYTYTRYYEKLGSEIEEESCEIQD